MSRAGNSRGAFTLVEVLLTVSILALGIVGILHSYAVSIKAMESGAATIEAVTFLKEKIFLFEQAALLRKGSTPGAGSGSFEAGGNTFLWETDVKASGIKGLDEASFYVTQKNSPGQFSLMMYSCRAPLAEGAIQ